LKEHTERGAAGLAPGAAATALAAAAASSPAAPADVRVSQAGLPAACAGAPASATATAGRAGPSRGGIGACPVGAVGDVVLAILAAVSVAARIAGEPAPALLAVDGAGRVASVLPGPGGASGPAGVARAADRSTCTGKRRVGGREPAARAA
jgi:hypothetical protein